MLELGTSLPPFELPDLDGVPVSSGQFEAAPALLVVFMCPHCPVVKHIRNAFSDFVREYQSKGLAVVGINSNDVVAFPDDNVEGMRDEIARAGYTFSYLVDSSQQIAKSFHAACTPDFFLFDRDRKLVYRGQFDDSRPMNQIPITGTDLRNAVDAVLEGRSPASNQKPSVGCNIKWKVGNEPEYFEAGVRIR